MLISPTLENKGLPSSQEEGKWETLEELVISSDYYYYYYFNFKHEFKKESL